MKKSERQKLAQEIYDKLTKLGIKMQVEGSWVKMDGPIPTDILMQSCECNDELAEIVKESK